MKCKKSVVVYVVDNMRTQLENTDLLLALLLFGVGDILKLPKFSNKLFKTTEQSSGIHIGLRKLAWMPVK